MKSVLRATESNSHCWILSTTINRFKSCFKPKMSKNNISIKLAQPMQHNRNKNINKHLVLFWY